MMGVNIFNVFIVLFLFLLVFGCAEFLYKKNVSASITRKVVHIGGGLVVALLPFLVNLVTVIILGVGFFLFLLFSKRRRILNSVHGIKKESIGALLFAPSLVLTAVIFWPINPAIFQGSALILGLSDGLAGVVGAKYGKKKYNITGDKTIEGSLVFFFITVLILLGILYTSSLALNFYGVLFVIGGALLLAIVEGMSGKGWDNLFIPIVAAGVIYFAL